MYYIALLEAYEQAEKADDWCCAGYTKALEILIRRESQLHYDGGD